MSEVGAMLVYGQKKRRHLIGHRDKRNWNNYLINIGVMTVEHGVTGFLANTIDEWEQALRVLVSDSNLRKRMGQAGRQKVEKEYCIQKTGPILSHLLLDVGKI
jgi:hypothetical protein